MSRPLETVIYDLDGMAGQQYAQSLKGYFHVMCRVSADADKRLEDEKVVCPSEFGTFLKAESVEAVLVFSADTSRGSLTSVVELCLEKGCHVFTLTPDAEELSTFKKCFHLSKAKEAMLFCGGNSRRYDPRLKRFRQMYRSGAVSMPERVEITVRGVHLGKDHDLLRDLDLLTWVIGEYPRKIASRDGCYEMAYPSGMTAAITFELGEGAAFEHKMQVHGENSSCLTVSNADSEVVVTPGGPNAAAEEVPRKKQKTESSAERLPRRFYADHGEEMAEFYHAVTSFSMHNVISVEDLLACDVAAKASKSVAARSGDGVEISYTSLDEFDAFRDYSEAPEAVRECYRLQRIYQTEEYVDNVLERYCKFERKNSFWELFDMLSTFVDLSDPDINLSNHQHLFQTAEGMRKDGLPEWMVVTGLIHDLGKIMYKVGREEDGTTMESQWGIVGDTYIVGCKIPDSIVYPEFNALNPDMKDPTKGSEPGIYKLGQGLSNAKASFGHDEYLYQLLRHNKVDLPEEAYYMVRFHSLYPWHKENAYSWLEDDTDRRMKWWVRNFNKYDLYTKAPKKVDEVAARAYYGEIIKKYFKDEIMW